MDKKQLRDALGAAVTDAPTALAAADRLCAACVQHLDVDGASISFIGGGRMQRTFGSSGELSRTLDELQFTYGQGPCLDAGVPAAAEVAEQLRAVAQDRPRGHRQRRQCARSLPDRAGRHGPGSAHACQVRPHPQGHRLPLERSPPTVVIASSEHYSSKAAAMTGIRSVQKNGSTDVIVTDEELMASRKPAKKAPSARRLTRRSEA